MKKLLFSLIATLLIGLPAFAKNRTVNTCQTSFNFFSLVTVWTGSITTYDEEGNIISQTGCGQNGGSWDWFWE
jgi:hypothetical protein